MLEDTLIMSEKESPDSKKKHFYTFQDENFSRKVDKIIKKYGDQSIGVIFEIKEVYIKDDTFIPAEITSYTVGEGGSIQDRDTLYISPKMKEDMEADGYTLVKKEGTFFLGDSATGDEIYTYCCSVDDERNARMSELLTEAQDTANIEGAYLRKDPDFFTMEFYSIRKNQAEDEDRMYYVAAYQKLNVLIQPYSLTAAGGRGIMYVEVYVIEMFAIIVFLIIVAAVVVKIRIGLWNKIQNKADI
jgi:hypothetical protein